MQKQNTQDDVINFLKTIAPSVIETHISMVFLDDKHAYKLKKALTLPFVDFSQTEQRLAACQDELRLNSRTAPDMYLEVMPIYRHQDGQLSFKDDGHNNVLDAVLKMRRFKDKDLLSNLAKRNKLNSDIMTKLAQAIAEFHKATEISSDHKGAKRIKDILELNRKSESLVNKVLGHERMTELNLLLEQEINKHSDLLNSRAAAGKVRHCHGDLHLNNICLWRKTPTLFDCLEFNQSMATTDVLYDLAFLLMDLWRYERYDLANWLMNRYMDHTNENDGLILLPLFMSLRASIRALVTATQVAHTDKQTDTSAQLKKAEQFLELSFELLKRPEAQLIAIGGLSGSGKSTLAKTLAPFIGAAPGARVLSSDRIRKKLFGVEPEERLAAEKYTQTSSNLVYRIQRELSQEFLRAGHSVIADAVFSKATERNAIENSAKKLKCKFNGLWLEAPAQQLMERVDARTNDPSDATVEVVKMQLKLAPGEIHWPRLNSAQQPKDVSNQALTLLQGQWPW